MKDLAKDILLLLGKLKHFSTEDEIINQYILGIKSLTTELCMSREKTEECQYELEIPTKSDITTKIFLSKNIDKANNSDTVIIKNSIQILATILDAAQCAEQINNRVLENAKNLEILINASPDLICIKNNEGRWLNANQGIVNQFRLENVDVTGKTNMDLAEYSVPELRNAFVRCTETDSEVLLSKKTTRNEEIIIGRDGEKVIIDMIKIPVVNKNGEIERIVEMGRDITERKAIEKSIVESEEKYRKYIDNTPVAMFVADENGKYVEVNKSACKLLGYTEEEILNKSIADIAYGPEIKGFYKLKKYGENRLETILKSKDGEKIFVDLLGVKLNQNRFMAFCVDISERKRLENQLAQSQRLESIGNLTAGIAHDFNNLLTVIMGNADMLRRQVDKNSLCFELAEDIIEASEKSSDLIKKLLLFSRKENMAFQSENLNDIINELMKIMHRLIGENIGIKIDLQETLNWIYADKNNIEQVILNLASNARDAMVSSGNILISTRNFEIHKDNLSSIPNGKIGEYVILTIEDDGCGIKKEILEKVFDPFFSTKEVGKGTGLGLSVVYGIVKKHNGWINIESQESQGTKINIFFPVLKSKKRNAAIKNNEILEPETERDECILFVEDDPAVLRFGEKLLKEYGFVVDIARNASEAKNVFIQNKGFYDLVISDVILPDINGVDLMEELKTINSGFEILFVSGYTSKELTKRIENNNEVYFMSKPYKNQEFINRIISIFDNH